MQCNAMQSTIVSLNYEVSDDVGRQQATWLYNVPNQCRSLLTQHSRLKMHTSSEVAAPMTWLVLTLLLSSAVYFCLLPLIFCPSIGWHPPTIYISPTHTHVPQAAAVETVKVVTTPVFPQIPRLQASKDFQVVVRLEAPPVAQQKARVPVDLAVVLDVGAGGGGSTGSARLDAVKKAVKFIIGQIHDNDRLAVVGRADAQGGQSRPWPPLNFVKHLIPTFEYRKKNEVLVFQNSPVQGLLVGYI
jgi:hypothetical protein